MSTLKGTTMHPRCRHKGTCWDLLEWFQLFSTSQNTSQIQFQTFLKKKKNWFPCCSTREDLSVDVSITYVGLILTKPGRFFSRHTETLGTDRIQFRQFQTFWKIFTFLGFHGVVCTREDLSVDISITNVGLILTKLRRFQLFVKSQNSNFELFWKKNRIFGFPWCSTREDLSIDVSITNVGLILTKLRWFQLFVKSQNSNFELFWKKKKIKFWDFHGVVLVKTFPLMYQLLM